MSNLKEKAKTAPRPFVAFGSLEIITEVNTLNQIIAFHAVYNGRAISIKVINMEIEEAWKKLEAFIAKQKEK